MRKYEVTFELFTGAGTKTTKAVTVEAGNKKMAMMRAFQKIGAMPEYSSTYKNVISVKEVA